MFNVPLSLLAALFILLPSSFIHAQGGSLTPPGAPAVLFKTLNEVEPRTPISSAPFTISTSGSYYLTANLTVTTGNAITISADLVTLDLNGFTISSTASPASGTAVLINGTRRNVTIKDGHIRGTTTFAAGTFTTGGFSDGISNSSVTSANLRVADVNVSSVGSEGIDLTLPAPSSRNMVERCTVSVCSGFGIRAGKVSDCHVDTAGSSGIFADVVSNCFGESVGVSTAADGISGTSVVENCRGLAEAGNGVDAGMASNSFGTSVSGTGLFAVGALNCQGTSTSGAAGINIVNGTASFCRGRRDGGIAISANIAIGCFANGTGTVSSSQKFLGTP